MDQQTNINERVEKYLTGKMSPEEILRFRKDLNSDTVLSSEYEKARGDIAKRSHTTITESGQSNRNIGRTVLYCLAACASLVLFLANGASYLVSNNLKSASNALYSELTAPVTRSANEVDALLESSYESIGQGELKLASQKLDDVDTVIDDLLKEDCENDEIKEYNHSVLALQQQEADWYRAIILMRKGRVSKSKDALLSIAEGDGIYAEQAQAVLDSKFHL